MIRLAYGTGALALVVACGQSGPRPADDLGMDLRVGVDAGPADAGLDLAPPDLGPDLVMVPDLGPDLPDMAPDMPDMEPDLGPPDPCFDGVRNGDETDVDCGGEVCEARCGDALRCDISADCASAVCIGGECQAPTCRDGIANGDETGADCGGPSCPGCGLGEGCLAMSDCAMGRCEGEFCVAEHCFDGETNVTETDVDCGGGDCAPCALGLRCAVLSDCLSGDCVDGFCLSALCLNGMLDPGEVDVDCGGPECPGCPDGTACTLPEDCLSDRCDAGSCTSCEDEVQNGTETDVDCGGTDCRPCAGGDMCAAPTDCISLTCTAGVCEGASTFYQEDFGAGDGGWTSGGTGSSWAYGMPSTATLTGAFSGTSVWVTNPSGNYNNNEDSFVESPSFDLSGTTVDPLIELAVIYETESGFDGMRLEMSLAGGAWTTVGSEEDPDWYPASAFGAGDEWDGSSGGWRVLRNTLVGAAGEADVRLRLFFDSDGSSVDEGVAFDDLRVFEDTCTNGLLDAGEGDVDCGGDCDPCADGLSCTLPAQCESGRCEMGTCTSCEDGILNGGELAIDCAGGGCGLCPSGTACTGPAICASGMCDMMVCTTPAAFLDVDFEADAGGFTVGGTAASWARGAPAGTVIDRAANGANAFVTNLTGDYNDNEGSFLESPPMDLRGAGGDPILSFNLWHVTESCCDEGFVEVSTDGGMTYTKVLAAPGAEGWYNDTGNQWWDGDSGGWTAVSTQLTGTDGFADVRLRFGFSSDGSVTEEGFAIVDVRVAAPQPDLETTIVESATSCRAGEIQVTNVGTAETLQFDLTTLVDGVPSVRTVRTRLDPGDTFRTTTAATTTLGAFVTAAGDTNAANDADSLSVRAPIVVTATARYVEDFETNPGGWLVSGTNADWTWGVVPTTGGTFIRSADSGSRAFVTAPGADYQADQNSQLTSPCFDTSAFTTDPEISFSRLFELESTNDNVFVEVSTDGGATWAKLGAFGTGTGWYNDLSGNFWDGLSGFPNAWARASNTLTGAAGQDDVRVRFVMVSNAASIEEDGFGLDDVILQ
ncbi:MAG: hypothetical protein AAF447_02650 [Myxococcota bacterium]